MKHLFLLNLILAASLPAADSDLSAADLAARLSEPDGTAIIRMRMETEKPPGTKKDTLQIQIKQRRQGNSAEAVYQILWPKERKGEALLIRQSGGPATATQRTVDGKTQPLTATQSIFGSDLAIADATENFYAWKNQRLDGTEVVRNVTCQILESKPGTGDSSIYGRVRSWIDPKRFVPLRVEKYLPSGQLARRIETDNVTADGRRFIPANLSIRPAQNTSATNLDGSRIQRGVAFKDGDFTVDGLAVSGPAAP